MSRMKIIRLLAIFIFFIFFCGAIVSGYEEIDQRFSALNKLTPGCAVGVRYNGSWLHEGYYGMANIQHKREVSEQTSFNIGSISKHFTAAMILILEDEGKLSRSDSLRKYWPEGPEWADEISIYHLIHHTSGLPDYLNDSATEKAIHNRMLNRQWIKNNMSMGLPTPKEFIDNEIRLYFEGLPSLVFKPGSQSSYSNTGYFFLGRIIEQVTGKSLQEFANEKIFEPLKMKNTYYSDPSDPSISLGATGYGIYYFDGQRFHPKTSILLQTNGGSGIFTTLKDFGKWVDHLKKPVIAPKAVWSEFLNLNDPNYGYAVSFFDAYYRNGLVVYKQRDGGVIYAHNGKSLDSMTSTFAFDPDKNVSFIKFCNFDEYAAKDILGDSYNTQLNMYWLYIHFDVE